MSLVSPVTAETYIKDGKYVCRELMNTYFHEGKIHEQLPDEDFKIFVINKTVIIEHRKGINNDVELYEYDRLDTKKFRYWGSKQIGGVKVDAALRTIVLEYPLLSQTVTMGDTVWLSQYKCQLLE